MSFEKPEIGYKWEILIGKRKRKRENGKRENAVSFVTENKIITFLPYGGLHTLIRMIIRVPKSLVLLIWKNPPDHLHKTIP